MKEDRSLEGWARIILKNRYGRKKKKVMKSKCEFYPSHPDEGPVCACGADIAGVFICTKQYSLICQWAIERREVKSKEELQEIKETFESNYGLSFTFLTHSNIENMSDNVLDITIKLLTDKQPTDPMMKYCIIEKERRKEMGDAADMAREEEENRIWNDIERRERRDLNKYPDGDLDDRHEDTEFRDEKIEQEEKEAKVICEFCLAGVKYHQYKSVLNDITEGDNLKLIPEPTNKFDPNAVQIHFDNSDKAAFIGFVPKKFSSEISGLLEIGKKLECILTEFNKTAPTWEMFKVEIREFEE